MQRLKAIYRRLDRLQSSRTFKLIALPVALIVCICLSWYVIQASITRSTHRDQLARALQGINLKNGDELAVSLQKNGTMYVEGRTYGGSEFINPIIPWFDENGRIQSPARLISSMLSAETPTWIPLWVLESPDSARVLAIVMTILVLVVVGLGLGLKALLTIVPTALVYWFLQTIGAEKPAVVLLGVGVLSFTFIVLIQFWMFLLGIRGQAFAVAHTLLKESTRSRISLVFIIVLLIALPLLPMSMDPTAPLRHRLQSTISWSLGLTFVVAACMTLFLACSSIAFEIRDRQIWQIVTKPVGALQYLIGKWLGIALLNLTLLLVAGVSSFMFVEYLISLPVPNTAEGRADIQQVQNAVLTARMEIVPDYKSLSPEELSQKREEIIRNDSELKQLDAITPTIVANINREIIKAFQLAQRSIPPQAGMQYTFSGLQDAKRRGGVVTLQYLFHTLAEDDHKTYPAIFVINSTDINAKPSYPSTFVPTQSHVLDIPAQNIRDDGTLSVTIYNLIPPVEQSGMVGGINFDLTGLTLNYKVGSFEWNFVRAILVQWMQLCFLGALGVTTATFLSFPVACLLSFTIMIAGMLSPYLRGALEFYDPGSGQGLDWGDLGVAIPFVFTWTMQRIAEAILFFVGSFGEYQPTNSLVEGRYVSPKIILEAMVQLVGAWSIVTLGLGYFIMRRRELAIYSGHG
ncbi:MAG TPA: hypothetical protein VG711_11590 [Phycisphaerales bacterium]|nr:hypothetical protein [Phycisphaerales bacterium]